MRSNRPQRFKKRLTVSYSTASGALPRTACTLDLSAGGLFLNTPTILPSGTHVLGRLNLPDGKSAEVHGVVVWAKRIPSALTAVARGGLGLKLVWAEPGYFEYLARAA